VNQTLVKLYIGFNNLRAVGAEYIAEGLAENTGLIELNIGANQIGPVGAEYIGDALIQNCTLSILNLWDNGIGDSGADCVANALRANTGLRDLYLNSNDIAEMGTEAISNALRDNETLTRLNFAGNNCGACVDELASALKVNAALRDLNMSGNAIGPEGAAWFADSLPEFKGLEKLLLCSCEIEETGCASLAEVLPLNSKLRELHISFQFEDDNEFGSNVCKEILQGFAETKTCRVFHEPVIGDYFRV